MTVAVLMTCHNRRETTLRCLEYLFIACDKCKGISFDVWLVDDGSSDGTAESVKNIFPQVHVVSGDGNLFWAKGMHRAWMAAANSRHYDFYLWLNDDVFLKPEALQSLISDYTQLSVSQESANYNLESFTPPAWLSSETQTSNFELQTSCSYPLVMVGACLEDGLEAQCSYGAKDKRDRLLVPSGSPQKADGWFNGNVVLVPSVVYEKVGPISNDYTHARADYDYAERLKMARIPFFCSSTYVGVCSNDFNAKIRDKSLWTRLRMLYQPGYWNLHDLWLIRRRYHGILQAILSCARLVFISLRGVK